MGNVRFRASRAFLRLSRRNSAILEKPTGRASGYIRVAPTSAREAIMIAKISHVNLFVRDQKKAYDVYVGKLGFKINTDMTMDNGMRWLTVTPPGSPEIEIILAEPRIPMIKADLVDHFKAILDADAMPGGVWNTENCEKAYEEMKGKEIEFTKKPTKEFYGIEAVFKDGCGNWFSLTQR
jgi:catechol 2,3-dioxygenase-like lactoylglutathione lyase family enzyme